MISRKRMAREVEDEKSKWGSRLKGEWETLGVNSVRGWCNKVKDRGWLASKMGEGRKKKGKKKTRQGFYINQFEIALGFYKNQFEIVPW